VHSWLLRRYCDHLEELPILSLQVCCADASGPLFCRLEHIAHCSELSRSHTLRLPEFACLLSPPLPPSLLRRKQEAADQVWAAWKQGGESSLFVLMRGLVVDSTPPLLASRLSTLMDTVLSSSPVSDAPATAVGYQDSVSLIPLDLGDLSHLSLLAPPNPTTSHTPPLSLRAFSTRCPRDPFLWPHWLVGAWRPAAAWLKGFRSMSRLEFERGAERLDRMVLCEVTPVSIQGRLALQSLTRWALLRGSDVTAVGRLELHLRLPFTPISGLLCDLFLGSRISIPLAACHEALSARVSHASALWLIDTLLRSLPGSLTLLPPSPLSPLSLSICVCVRGAPPIVPQPRLLLLLRVEECGCSTMPPPASPSPFPSAPQP
jgi:hypothetical protein